MPKLVSYLTLLIFTFFTLVFVPAVYAQDVSGTIKRSENQFVGLVHVASCLILGHGVQDGACFGSFQGSQTFSGGLLAITGNFLSELYKTPPLSTNQYLASIGSNLGIVKEVHAQVGGSGNSVISLVFRFWEGTRNLAYILLTVIFIVIGVMVLLGTKTGQSVVSVQSALPGLVISLIMITFSYFFAALLTDIAFIGSYIVGFYFTNIVSITQANTASILESQNLLTIFVNFILNLDNFLNVYAFIVFLGRTDALLQIIIKGIGAFIGGQLMAPIGTLVGSIYPGGGQAGGIIGSIIGVFGSALAPNAAESLTALFVYIILGIALVIAMLKLIVDLLKRYITILFLTILAPLQFLFASFPGNGKTYESWIRNMLCQVLPFPAVFGAFFFASYFLVGGNFFGVNNPNIVPISGNSLIQIPIINSLPIPTFSVRMIETSSTMPLFGGLNLGIIAQIIGFGILLATPAIPEFVCKLVGGKLDDVFGKEIQGNWTGGQGRFASYRQRVGNASGRLTEDEESIGQRYGPEIRGRLERVIGGRRAAAVTPPGGVPPTTGQGP